MKNTNHYLLCILLIGLSGVGLAYTQQYCNNWANLSDFTQSWLENGLLSLGSSLVASVVVIFLYNEILDKNSKQDRMKRTRIAFKQMRIPMLRHFMMLIGMYKSSLADEIQVEFAKMEDVFGNNYIETLKNLNLMTAPLGIREERNWGQIIVDENIKFQNQMNEILLRYIQYIDSDVIDTLEDLANSNFVTTAEATYNNARYNYGIRDFASLPDVLFQGTEKPKFEQNWLTFQQNEFYFQSLREHVDKFIEIINIHNCIYPTERILWAERAFEYSNVKLGCSRIGKIKG